MGVEGEPQRWNLKLIWLDFNRKLHGNTEIGPGACILRAPPPPPSGSANGNTKETEDENLIGSKCLYGKLSMLNYPFPLI